MKQKFANPADDPLVVVLHANKQAGRMVVNDVANVYGKENAQTVFEQWASDGLLRYYRNKKAFRKLRPNRFNCLGWFSVRKALIQA